MSSIFRLYGDETERSAGRFAAVLAGAGLVNVLIFTLLLCRLPSSPKPTLSGLLARAAIYVVMAAAAGALATWFYWRRSSSPAKDKFPTSIQTFALASISAWVWVPAMVLLSDERLAGAALIAATGAGILGAALRGMLPSAQSGQPQDDIRRFTSNEMFVETLRTPETKLTGYAIAVLAYASALAAHDHSVSLACVLLAASAFTFAWNWTLAGSILPQQTPSRPAAKKLGWIMCAAFVVTVWALLDGVAHRSRVLAADVALAHDRDAARDEASKKDSKRPVRGGYESIILWPFPKKLQIIPPLPERSELLAPGTTRPVVIRFDGPYWYYQPPETGPGPDAHQARGTPLRSYIQSSNTFPLNMEAHQHLSSAIRVSRCRAIEVEIENREISPHTVEAAVILTDSTAPGKPAIDLGQQVLKTSLPDYVPVNGGAAFETLRFEIPAHARIRRFDEISVKLLPDVGTPLVGPRIAVEQFQLFPR